MTQYLLPATILAAVGSGLIAGLLLAFSNTVMKALTRIPPEHGMAAMQQVNVIIINPLFMLVFLGTALLCALLVLHSLLHWKSPAAIWLLIGAVFYLVGTFGVTIAFNVPLNNMLAASEASAAKAAEVWPGYVAQWLRWNHLRVLMSFAAAISLTYAATQARSVAP